MRRKKVCMQPENLFQPAQEGFSISIRGFFDLRMRVVEPPRGGWTTEKAVLIN